MDDKQIIDEILMHNDYLRNLGNNDIIKVVKKQSRQYSQNIIIEVSPLVRKAIMLKSFLYFGWQKCKVDDHLIVRRCFLCQRYGHIKKECKFTATCPKCGENHEEKDCNCENKKCSNCFSHNIRNTKNRIANKFSVDHYAYDKKLCSCYIHQLNVLKNKIDYGE